MITNDDIIYPIVTNRFCRKFTLKQHTPIIHFQHDREGATLRATELKPKLDRFLISHVFKNDFNIYKAFLIGYKEGKKQEDFDGKEAFDYKIKINHNKDASVQKYTYKTYIKTPDEKNKIGAYFGDNKAVSFSDREVLLEVVCFHEKLLTAIKDNIEFFLCITGFGTRSNKGFGSFSLLDTTVFNIENNLQKEGITYFKFSSNEPLKEILEKYQILKSGNTRKGKKSFLMEHFQKNGLRWEKRWIKKQIQAKNPNMFEDLKDDYHDRNGFNPNPSEKYTFARALLGLADRHEYLTKSFVEADKDKDNYKVQITIKPRKSIGRFKSPINFRVFDNSVFVIVEDINPHIFNKEFEFSASYKNGTCSTPLGRLSTPIEKFDLKNFIKSYFSSNNQQSNKQYDNHSNIRFKGSK